MIRVACSYMCSVSSVLWYQTVCGCKGWVYGCMCVHFENGSQWASMQALGWFLLGLMVEKINFLNFQNPCILCMTMVCVWVCICIHLVRWAFTSLFIHWAQLSLMYTFPSIRNPTRNNIILFDSFHSQHLRFEHLVVSYMYLTLLTLLTQFV